jgi:tungstate transport system ATP-binding protein
MSAALIELRAASVRFGAKLALESVDFAVHAGECIALVGANGCGKTTLLRALHGQLACSGQRRALGAAGSPLRQAMVYQRPFLLRLSVWRNLNIALWLAGVPAAQRAARAQAALQRVGLAAERNRPARVLSGGQQQRLAIARAWAVRPELLFLDEPTASLDPSAKRDVESLVRELLAEGITVVMSTHNLGQAKRLATRVVYLEAGRVVADRSCQQFFNDPLPQAAAAFLRGELGG